MKTILVFLLIFSIIVIIHEFGHFYFARRAGIRVREFSIGMGPKLFSKQADDGTTYTLRVLPMGGYVRLAGLNEEDEVQPGMSVGLGFNDKNEVDFINLSDSTSTDELPVNVDFADLSELMVIDVFEMNSDTKVRYPVSKSAKIMEKDGTILMVAPIESRYESANVKNKILTNIAGPMNNFILSIVVFTIIGFIVGSKQTDQWNIAQVQEGSPAQEAGLQAGDVITKLDKVEIQNWEDLVNFTQESPGKKVETTYLRNNKTMQTTMTLDSVKDEQTKKQVGQIGIVAGFTMKPMTFFEKITYGFVQTYEVIAMVLGVILGWFTKGFNLNELGGPVAMAQTTQKVVKYGYLSVLNFMAVISANLGFMNLLPIPALDGGKILLNIVEGVRGKPLSQEKEGIISLIGVIALLILMVLVTWNDIMRLFN